MYDELIGRLRANGELFQKYIPNAEGEVLLQAADAIEELSKPRWIPVTERLPDMHVEVLVCTEDYGETQLGFAMVAVFDGTGWLETWERKTYLTAVTHWMPLPEPPKEET